jgi:membrane associated rhomboid family serine protease
MLYLWVFGDNVEDQIGPMGYLVFYLVSGVAAGLTHVVFNAGSVVPTIGASGAVAGILGAYFVSFPRAKVLALFPVSFLLPIVEVRAVYYLAFWFVFQVFSGLAAIQAGAMAQPIAWWAHIGGFIVGAILIKLFRNRSYVR